MFILSEAQQNLPMIEPHIRFGLPLRRLYQQQPLHIPTASSRKPAPTRQPLPLRSTRPFSTVTSGAVSDLTAAAARLRRPVCEAGRGRRISAPLAEVCGRRPMAARRGALSLTGKIKSASVGAVLIRGSQPSDPDADCPELVMHESSGLHHNHTL
jgi:hypothetical protein